MTAKRYRKLIRAHFTEYYMADRSNLRDWIANAYRVSRDASAKNYLVAYNATKNALPIKSK